MPPPICSPRFPTPTWSFSARRWRRCVRASQEILPALKRGAIVTDVGSVKAGVVRELESLVPKPARISSAAIRWPARKKPACGAARADLFENAVCVVTPTKKSNAGRGSQGGAILEIAGRADAAAGAGTARFARQPLQPSAARRGGGAGESGFESGAVRKRRPRCARTVFATRRASPPVRRKCGATSRWPTAKIWRGRWTRFIAELQKFQRALAKADAKAVTKFFETAKPRRDHWCALQSRFAGMNQPQMNTDEHAIDWMRSRGVGISDLLIFRSVSICVHRG